MSEENVEVVRHAIRQRDTEPPVGIGPGLLVGLERQVTG